MKLSDIKGERTIEVIADLIDPIAEIASDKAAAELFVRKALPEGADPKEYALKRLREGLPMLLKTHKKALVAIFATIKGVSAEEYAAQLTLGVLVADLAELLADDAFKSLFT